MIKLAIKEANRARHKQHHLGAVLLRGGKPIATGHNFSHIHAEHCVLNRAYGATEGTTLLIVRIRRDGSMGMARPCPTCMSRLVSAGVRKVIYSDNDGVFQELKLSSIMDDDAILDIRLQNLLWYKCKPTRSVA